MKTLRSTGMILLLLHALLLVGFGVWLVGSGRVDRERLRRVSDLFKVTVADEKQLAEADKKQQEEQAAKALEAARLQSVGEGPATVNDRLAASAQADQLAMLRVERIQREKQDLLRQLDLAKDQIAKQRTELDALRKGFDDARAQETKLRDDRDFQRAVETYETLKPKQVKEMFAELLAKGGVSTVVDYLAAMDTRKVAAVLAEFKTPEDTKQAVDLVQRLRSRGVDALAPTSRTARAPAADNSSTADTATRPAESIATGTPTANAPLSTP